MTLIKDPIATELAGSVLLAMIEAYDDPDWAALAPCEAGLVPGNNLVADHCCAQDTGAGTQTGEPCEGQLTVRVSDSYPTRNFPDPWIGAMSACESWAVELEIAVMRCSLTMGEDGSPPALEDDMVVAERVLGDVGLIRQTLMDFARAHGNQGLALGRYTPMGPEGGCTGAAVTATFLVE